MRSYFKVIKIMNSDRGTLSQGPLTTIKQAQRIFAVCYGGGHVLMLIPVLEQLRSLGYEIHVLGLTAAGIPLKEAGFEPLGFLDFLTDADTRAIAHGKRLAEKMHCDGKVVSLEESIAYLGLSYADLEDQLGIEGARAEFERLGRQAFLPVSILRRVFDRVQPDVVITTSSPRAELAAVKVAAERNIPSVGMIDLFGGQVIGGKLLTDILSDYVCIPFEGTIPVLEDWNVTRDQMVITGNPNFNWVTKVPAVQDRSWRERHHLKETDILALYAMQPETRAYCDLVEDSLVLAVQQNPDLKVAVRAHPCQPDSDARLVLERLGDAGLPTFSDSLSELIYACDVLVTGNSTVALEAVLLGRKAALFYINEDLQAHGLPLHLYYDWVTFSTTVAAGARAISQVTCDTIADQLQRRAKVCEDWHCDGNAHLRIAEVVIKAIESKQNRNAA